MLDFNRFQLLTIVILYAFMIGSCSENKKESKSSAIEYMRSEVLSDDALKKSWSLLEEGQKLVDAGKSIDAVLKIFPVGTLFSTNKNSVLFFIDGSIPMLIELNRNYKQRRLYKGGGSKNVSVPKFSFLPSLKVNALTTSTISNNDLLDVIGNDVSDDKRQQKKALIIAPYNSTDFKGEDDADIAYEYLKKNRNYRNNITFLKDSVTLEDFTKFAQYDLVHLSTHAKNYCEIDEVTYNKKNEIEYIDISTRGCFTAIATDIKHGIKNLNIKKQLEEAKKYYGKYAGAIYLSATRVYLKASFFENLYSDGITNSFHTKGGLKNKIWVFSACELGENGMIRLVMQDILEDSHFLNWENSVNAEDAYVAFNEFYKNLTIKGLNATASFDVIPDHLKTDLPLEIKGYTDDDGQYVFYDKGTSLEHLQTGNPRHGIEVIDMLHPESGNLLVQNDFYPLSGDFNDGDDETLSLKVKLIGYTKAEFLENQMRLSLTIDDEIVLTKQAFLPDVSGDAVIVETLKEHEYGVTVAIDDIAIPDVGTKQAITLKAILHLNDAHISFHKETVSIVQKGIIATAHGQGANVKYTYDAKTKAVRMNIPNGTMYYDDTGFVYTNRGKKGWIKMKNGGMNINQFSNMPKGTALKADEIAEIDAATNELPPFINFAMNFRMIAFESNDKFKKTLVDCGKPVECSKYTSNDGFHTIFNPAGQLIELAFDDKVTIKYKYGDFDVKLPDAQLFDMPVLDFEKAEEVWKKHGIDINFN